MNFQLDEIFTYAEIVAESLSIISCYWYFVMYIRKKEKSIQFSFILALLISDCIFNISLLLPKFYPWLFLDNVTLFLQASVSSMMFSIIWSATIAYLVYRSFLEYDFDAKKIFWKAVVMVLILILISIFVLSYDGGFGTRGGTFLFILLLFSTLAIFYFYHKSIRVASQYMEYEPRSTKRYITNLRYYSLAQIITYLPFFSFTFLFNYFAYDINGGLYAILISVSNSFGGLSGFVTVMLFIKNGPMGFEKSKQEPMIPHSDHTETFV